MMRSLYSGVSGLKNHQIRMDVIGNNIANVNTVGFKGSRVIFQDLFSQTTKTASGTGGNIGGTNPQQIGLGMSTATIDTLQSRTATQYTGNTLDLAIEGDGYFIVQGGGDTYYTRAGNFYVDNDDMLVNGDGFFVQVFEFDSEDPATGEVTYKTDPSSIKLDSTRYKNISIDKNGVITGLDMADDDKKVTLGVIAVGTFANENALEKVGGNLYQPTNNSGAAVANKPGEDGAGMLSPGTLEMSNIDLSNEFTDMIITQRGFQANSRIITVSDTLLEELVNLKR